MIMTFHNQEFKNRATERVITRQLKIQAKFTFLQAMLCFKILVLMKTEV